MIIRPEIQYKPDKSLPIKQRIVKRLEYMICYIIIKYTLHVSLLNAPIITSANEKKDK